MAPYYPAGISAPSYRRVTPNVCRLRPDRAGTLYEAWTRGSLTGRKWGMGADGFYYPIPRGEIVIYFHQVAQLATGVGSAA